ncbi:bifunctional DNA primase/polymerase [Streptomyces sp. WMMB303]|uniref:bifunctional DNA primase/polymerase n=1 Tax=Streptomyces sp. WMMB303 TaxID=3034154 RepID=UPI0023EDB3AA|nr:bifunctional DNA primase/polymerase [Streptomyces sp. WMMB303]MDF4250452.1 bifunctional DNA primase/polymerase [Streptomyces sp. WMMB303]
MPTIPASPLPHAAQNAAERGWSVFPLVPGNKRPAVRSWEQRATTDPDRIARCWAAGDYNIGIATGPSRLVVIDLDTPKDTSDAPPPDAPAGVICGEDALAALAEEHGQSYPCETYTVRTGSGGTHLYFAAPAGAELRNTAGRLAWKVDTRAGGGYVVGAASGVDGRSYTVLHDAPVAPLPAWLAALLAPAPLPPQQPITVPLKATERHSRYVRAAVDGELTRIAKAGRGEGNNALYHASVALGQLVAGGVLKEAEATAYLTEAATRKGRAERESAATIASGLRAGAKRPRSVAA